MQRNRITFALMGLFLAAAGNVLAAEIAIEQICGGVSGDTSAQAIQLRFRSAGQSLAPLRLVAYDATGSNPVVLIDFNTEVDAATSGTRVLITTANFASYCTPALDADFTLTNRIPAAYLAGGKVTLESDVGVIVWAVAFGTYSGTNTGSTANDADGLFNPPFASALPSAGLSALTFHGAASALSTTNAADYAIGTPVWTNNLFQAVTLGARQPLKITNTNSSGVGSLHAVFQQAPTYVGGTVTIDATEVTGTISGIVDTGLFLFGQCDVKIEGPTAGGLELKITKGSGSTFEIASGRTLTITNLVIKDSLSIVVGSSGTFIANKVTVKNCFSTTGVIVLSNGSGIFNQCSFLNCVSTNGGVYVRDLDNTPTTIVINNCTFVGNTSTAVHIESQFIGSTAIISNSTFNGNSGNGPSSNPRAGAIHTGLVSTLVTIDSCTITNNTAGTSGSNAGGIKTLSTNMNVRLKNSIVAGNISSSAAFSDVSGSLVSDGYNFIGIVDGSATDMAAATGDQFGSVSLPKDPLLEPLGDNGGPTQSHALKFNSPCIDKGSTSLTSDHAGRARPLDVTIIPNGAGTGHDIGAFEATPTLSVSGGPLTFPPTSVGDSSAPQAITVSGNFLFASATIAPPVNYEISTQPNAAFSITPIQLAGPNATLPGTIVYVRYRPLSAGTHPGNLALSGAHVTAAVSVTGSSIPPAISVSGGPLAFTSVALNVPTAARTLTLSGTNMQGDLTAQVLQNFEVSLNGTDYSGSVTITSNGNATIPATSVFVRYKPVSGMAHAQQIAISSTDAQTRFVLLNGSLTPNAVPQIASAATASPNPAIAGTPVQFSVVAVDTNNDTLGYRWLFGDGTDSSDATVVKTYSVPGVYAATVLVSDGKGGSATSTVTFTIIPEAKPDDADGDGFPDALETAAGSDPNDAEQTPAGTVADPVKLPIVAAKFSAKLNFQKEASDSLVFGGSLLLDAGTTLNGKEVVLDIANVTFKMTMDDKGKSKTQDTMFALSPPKGDDAQMSKFALKVKGRSLTALMDYTKVDKNGKKVSTNIPIRILFEGRLYTLESKQSYTGKSGKSGGFSQRK